MQFFLYGENSFFTYKELKKMKLNSEKIFHSLSKDEIAGELKKILKKQDLIFFKASRGMKLEEIISKVFAD